MRPVQAAVIHIHGDRSDNGALLLQDVQHEELGEQIDVAELGAVSIQRVQKRVTRPGTKCRRLKENPC